MDKQEYLTADAAIPFVTNDKLRDELLLYHLDTVSQQRLFTTFEQLSGKSIDPNTKVLELSGGQRVILMALLALFCPAPAIRFINLMSALDLQRREALGKLLDASEKTIIMEEQAC